MNWYKNIKISKNKTIEDLAYNEWKKSSFDANVGAVIYRIYQSGTPKNASSEELDEKIEDVMSELISEEGELNMWSKVLEDSKYFSKIKNSVKKKYKKKIEEIEKVKSGPLQINTPQTPNKPPGSGGGVGGLLM